MFDLQPRPKGPRQVLLQVTARCAEEGGGHRPAAEQQGTGH